MNRREAQLPGMLSEVAGLAATSATVRDRAEGVLQLLERQMHVPLAATGAAAPRRNYAGGRHIGFLSLLSADPSRPSRADRRVVAAVTAVIADDLDRTRAGIVLTRGGDVLPLPGLPDDRLLARGSPSLGVAADELADSGGYISFLAPAPGTGGEQLIRVTALDVVRRDLNDLRAAVLLGPPGDLRGLTVPDLRVLGLVVEGVTDVPALAQSLHMAEEAVADSLARSLVALRTSDLTAAAVRALRSGLRIPPGVTAAT